MKRAIIFTLITVLAAVSMLVACGGNKNEGASTDADTAPASSEAATTAEYVYDDPNTVAPGVAWSDLVPITDDVNASENADDSDVTEDTLGFGTLFPESGIELPIIPLP